MPLKNDFNIPKFYRIEPPLYLEEPEDDELVWFNLVQPTAHKPIYINNETSNDTKDLSREIFIHTVSLREQKMMLDELAKDENYLKKLKITKDNIASLIEYNPSFASKALLILLKNEPTEYLSAILNIELSLNSLEVVNLLTSQMELPHEFLHLYIINAIISCEKMTDKFMQNRSVRILCVFLNSLVRKKIIDVKDFLIEIESFCINFSMIKEASELYKLCKTAEVEIKVN